MFEKCSATLFETDDHAIDEISHFSFENHQNKLWIVHDIPEFRGLPQECENDGTLKGSSNLIPPTVNGFEGQGNACLLDLF